MFHAALFTAVQMPDISGLPSGVRGMFCAAASGAAVRNTAPMIQATAVFSMATSRFTVTVDPLLA
jgi:hypothetical protein